MTSQCTRMPIALYHYPWSFLSSAHLMYPSCSKAMQNLLSRSHWLSEKTRPPKITSLDSHGQPAAHLGTVAQSGSKREVARPPARRSHNTPLSQKVQKGKEKLALAAGEPPKKWSCDSCVVLNVCVQRLQASDGPSLPALSIYLRPPAGCLPNFYSIMQKILPSQPAGRTAVWLTARLLHLRCFPAS